MYHKNLVFFVQCHSRKFFFTKDLYPLEYKKPFNDAINFLDELLLCKLYICIIENEEKHSQDHFYSGVAHEKSLLEESNFS